MQAPRNQVGLRLRYSLFFIQIKYLFNWKQMHNKNMSSHLEKESYPKHFHIMFKIQTVAGKFNCSRCLFRWKQMHNTNMSPFHKKNKHQWERMLFEEILCPPFGQEYYTKSITLNIELLTSTKDWCLGSPQKNKKNEENLLEGFFDFRLRSLQRLQGWEKTKNSKKPKVKNFLGVFFAFLRVFLVFRLGSFHRLQGWERNKKLEENQKKPKKPKSWEKCCAQRFPPGDWFFWFSSHFFWFLDSEAFIGYRAEKKNKKTRRKPKKPKKPKKSKSWEKCCAQGFLQGIGFFGFFGFFGFPRVFFWFLDSEAFIGYRAEKKTKKLEENHKKKTKKPKKPKSWEKCCAQGFLLPHRGVVFWVFLVSLVFFGFLRVFWFLIYEFVWHISDIITKTNIFWCYNNKKNHFWAVQKPKPPFQLKGPCVSNKTPNNYSVEITRAHRLPFSFKNQHLPKDVSFVSCLATTPRSSQDLLEIGQFIKKPSILEGLPQWQSSVPLILVLFGLVNDFTAHLG